MDELEKMNEIVEGLFGPFARVFAAIGEIRIAVGPRIIGRGRTFRIALQAAKEVMGATQPKVSIVAPTKFAT